MASAAQLLVAIAWPLRRHIDYEGTHVDYQWEVEQIKSRPSGLSAWESPAIGPGTEIP